MIPYEASTAEAIEAINQALQSTEGLLQEPTPRTLVKALEPNGVHLRATYWLPTRGIDGDKLQSDLRLKIKVALQKARHHLAVDLRPASASGRIPVETLEPTGQRQLATATAHSPRPSPPGDRGHAHQAEANLRKDTEAAETSRRSAAAPEASPIDHAIKQAEANAVAEGNNMLVDAKA